MTYEKHFISFKFTFINEVKPTLVESVKKLLIQIGFEPTTFGLLVRRFTS